MDFTGIKDRFLFKVNRYSLFCIIAGYVLNIGGYYASQSLKLPIWFDTVGTMFAAIQFGPIAGMFVGTLSALTTNLISGNYIYYTVIGALTGFIIGLFFSRRTKIDGFTVVSVAMLSALLSSLVSIPLNYICYDGMPGNIWGNALYEMLYHSINSRPVITVVSELFVDIPDRVISMLFAVFFVKNIRIIFKQKKLDAGLTTIISIFLIAGILLGQSVIIYASSDLDNREDEYSLDFNSDYEVEIYGDTSQTNTVLQTDNGYLWVGTYSGLYLFDGFDYEEVVIDKNIRNVMSLFEDSKNRLWIGTNDSGAYCYDFKDGHLISYSTKNGLGADSVRSICEDEKGNIYLGTVASLSLVTPDGGIKTYDTEKDLYYTKDLVQVSDGYVAGVTNDGLLYILNDEKILLKKSCDIEGGLYRRVEYCKGQIIAGLNSNLVEIYDFNGSGLKLYDSIEMKDLSYINDILYDLHFNGYFVCCQNGIGFIEHDTGKFTKFNETSIKGEINSVFVDMQDNIWCTSTKEGLIKFSKTPFENVTKNSGIETDVVNSVLISDGEIYLGLDKGLEVLDLETENSVYKKYLKMFTDVRIRHIMKDSKGNLWISTYSDMMLVRISPQEEITYFTDEEGGLIGNRIRLTQELSDGRILVSGNNGLSFIEGDKVVKTIGQEDGLSNQYILSVCEREDGTILAASDGDGIYVIKDYEIVDHIGREDGLETAVVMRIVKYKDGYFYVTSNAIYYDDGKTIKMLDNFYSNNYDIIVWGDKCFITSSAGLFVIDGDKLINNDIQDNYDLLDHNWGLRTMLNANSWNQLYDNDLYLCCTDGVRKISADKYNFINDEFDVQLRSIYTLEDNNFIDGGNGGFYIPALNGRIDFNVAVNNYTLSNPIVAYYLEGREEEGIYVHQNELIPLSYAYLPGGEYVLCIRVYESDTNKVITSKRVKIIKEKMMYERLYFQIYLIFVAAYILFYIVWLFYTINNRSRKIMGLQKQMIIDPMTGILNKAGSNKVLRGLCQEETGMLLMIDLDSFKLVNDLYGHDMGDKILIRFAELIKNNIDNEDVCGRLGGDEFIAFMKNTLDEEDVAKLTTVMNREIMKSAKEYMGQDMNIPIGTSIGVVRVPFDGKDMEELMKLADKALYVVKQNGKHGYSFYQNKRSEKDLDLEKKDKNNLNQIKKIIGERNEGKGAYEINFDKLQTVYKFLNRNDKLSHCRSGFIRLSIKLSDGRDVSDEIKEDFEDNLIRSLNKNDVVSIYSGDFFILIAGQKIDGDYKDFYQMRIKSIIDKWNNKDEKDKYIIDFEVDLVGE
ncbi:MAG: diguanylate cyclase [Eubacterium sp.]|nr:diguanylate cyclase [Eubacterium sp.]